MEDDDRCMDDGRKLPERLVDRGADAANEDHRLVVFAPELTTSFVGRGTDVADADCCMGVDVSDKSDPVGEIR